MTTEKVIETFEPVVETVKSEKAPKWKSKVCRVVNYIPSQGILGFDFDGVGCQINIEKNLDIDQTIKVQYTGEIGRDIKFKI